MTKSGSIKLFRLKGIELRIHFSLIFLLVYVVFVAAAQYPYVVAQSQVNPAAVSGSPFSWGLVFALGLFASVAIHEFGHAFTAQGQGLEVRGITLMMLGGVSELGQVSEAPYAEFLLAVIGPVVSLLIAAVPLVFHVQLAKMAPHLSGPLVYTYWLGRANLVLGVFNLLPAFPLDGGRALRSVLAARMGMIPGTKRAVEVSRGFAWFLGVLGLLSFNILLMMIAFFIYFAARSELSVMMARKVLGGLKAKDLMILMDPIDENATLRDAATRMIGIRQAVLPVQTEGDRPALISLDHLRLVKKELWSKVLVAEIMEVFPRAVAISDPIPVILQEILTNPRHILPVHDGGRMIGIIRYQDLTDVLQFKGLEEAA